MKTPFMYRRMTMPTVMKTQHVHIYRVRKQLVAVNSNYVRKIALYGITRVQKRAKLKLSSTLSDLSRHVLGGKIPPKILIFPPKIILAKKFSEVVTTHYAA